MFGMSISLAKAKAGTHAPPRPGRGAKNGRAADPSVSVHFFARDLTRAVTVAKSAASSFFRFSTSAARNAG